ncbi:hypothetical protein HY635_03185 [Candidatus Uhrbacteria bacterium]|nr:hypothetical protein [Candidatus Uhrbacteria bacterium]
MIGMMHRRTALLTIAVFLLASASVTEAAAPLKLTLRVPNRTYLVGEPVPITVELKNTSWRAQKVRYPLSYEWGLDVLITPEGGATREYVSPLHAFAREASRRPNPAPQKLSRRKSLTTQEHIAFDDAARNDFAFPTPGRYAVQMRHPYERGVRSNTVTITVAAPTGRDADALEFVVQHDLKALLSPHARRVGANEEQLQALRELADANVCIRGSCSPGFVPLGVTRYGEWARIALRALGEEIEEPITP